MPSHNYLYRKDRTRTCVLVYICYLYIVVCVWEAEAANSRHRHEKADPRFLWTTTVADVVNSNGRALVHDNIEVENNSSIHKDLEKQGFTPSHELSENNKTELSANVNKEHEEIRQEHEGNVYLNENNDFSKQDHDTDHAGPMPDRLHVQPQGNPRAHQYNGVDVVDLLRHHDDDDALELNKNTKGDISQKIIGNLRADQYDEVDELNSHGHHDEEHDDNVVIEFDKNRDGEIQRNIIESKLHSDMKETEAENQQNAKPLDSPIMNHEIQKVDTQESRYVYYVTGVLMSILFLCYIVFHRCIEQKTLRKEGFIEILKRGRNLLPSSVDVSLMMTPLRRGCKRVLLFFQRIYRFFRSRISTAGTKSTKTSFIRKDPRDKRTLWKVLVDFFRATFKEKQSSTSNAETEKLNKTGAINKKEIMELKEMASRGQFIPKRHATNAAFRSILSQKCMMDILPHMPARCACKDWTLTYASELHGYSLYASYRACKEVSGPCLLAIMDTNQYVFGVFCSEPLQLSGGQYYGNGETFLVRFLPKFSVYKWTGKNSLFMIGTNEMIAFGGGGKFALWLDSGFERGTSERGSQTFDSPCLASAENFKCVAVELWSFKNPSV
uniref:Oxidation resistance protein 1 n=1 Tax=Aplanochytrium stocchinoi TaxID=215587 RepID=A0A7S3LLX4_9STRA|mmetsp:Transcript_22925/g.28122  ORF Transcript_22925/g.28122 Transcript_22925/m.28122 type:complete len:610 (+) Transcript_22925:224-2053(+)|eukprot:CAMPEP_0204831550 /NCGR_PEP_ID=MMETSP1346-20131115/10846_1 /ASSEMBLY_ACC=CAM_ASM_000771 /TAXON_ID=215587 /ORGANISM="Aplanochytrium stocchinoi, Strain GSBS06" /LENGTH=609 /DNA_ID=CAMNT_0051962649 /DNA_START=168 /DNA_END=1997 /DNA_ORIENTATION=+